MTPWTTFHDDVKRTLARLGTSANEIALTLQAKGVTGNRVMSDSCPLANFLTTEFPDENDDILVGPALVRRRRDSSAAAIAMTSAQAEFTYRFDQGEFPFLDSERIEL